MIEQKYIDLIHRELDGLNSPQESSALQSYLSRNKAARNLFDDLLRMSQMLNDVEEIDPSPNVKKAIMNSLDLKKYRVKDRKHSFQFSPSAFKFNLKYAYVFATGLILGILGYNLISGSLPSPDSSYLIGTFINKDRPIKFKTIDQFEFDKSGAHGSLNLKSGNSSLLIRLDMKSPQQIQIQLKFNKHNITFSGLQHSGDNPAEIAVKDSLLTIYHTGSSRYIILLKKRESIPSPLSFKIRSDGTLLFQKTIPTEAQVNSD